MAASAAYSLEAELGELEGCARGISSSTSVVELSFLEEQVAAAAAKVQHSELQVSCRDGVRARNRARGHRSGSKSKP